MLLLWRIRYIDSKSRQFGDHDLELDTSRLSPAERHAIELCYESGESGYNKAMLRFRHLFAATDLPKLSVKEMMTRGFRTSMMLLDYFEDENGKPLTLDEVCAIRTGKPNVRMFPSHYESHDIELALAPTVPIRVETIALDDDAITRLAYFKRDLLAMGASPFFDEGPGKLQGNGLHTSTTEDQIKSFALSFRNLYMQKEKANFEKTARLYETALHGHPLADWMSGCSKAYKASLEQTEDILPFSNILGWTFSRKRLIDVLLYTKFVHQPKPEQLRKYREQLSALNNNVSLHDWASLSAMWRTAIRIYNAGREIVRFYRIYCETHKVNLSAVPLLGDSHPHLGTAESTAARRERLLEERISKLAMELWVKSGAPEDQFEKFMIEARSTLAG